MNAIANRIPGKERKATDDESESQRREHDATADQHGNARTVDDARKDVASQFIGAEPVRGRRRVEPHGQVDGGRILRGDPVSEQGECNEDDDQHHAHCGERIVAGISCNPAAERDGGGGHGTYSPTISQVGSYERCESSRNRPGLW